MAWLLSATPDRGGLQRALSAADRRLNLRYLAERWQREDERIAQLLGGRVPDPTQRVAVVTPSHGVPLRYVRAFVRSLERQSHPNWELCLCDDADPVREVPRYLAGLAQRQPRRIRLVSHARNRGVAAATRSALALTSAPIVVFADADDLMHPDALALVVQRMSELEDADLVYTNHDVVTAFGYRIDPIYKPGWSPELLLSVNYINHLVAVRREALGECAAPFVDGVSGAQDLHLLLQLSRVARRVHHIPAVLYHWRARPGSMAAGARAKPWVGRAWGRVSRAHALSLPVPLTWTSRDDGHPVLALASPSKPPIVVATYGAPRSDRQRRSRSCVKAREYAGQLLTVKLGGGEPTAPALIDALRRDELAPSGGGQPVILFRSEQRPPLEGDLERMVAFAVQPHIGCVWPFYSPVRGTYTVVAEPG
ncbi:MAG: glycosyltransferase, partial [Deltaproteobacteria bacterium]|nr:glycosyltransferase [Deltaproteobacteria bacterium]MBW2530721.1 glycosyltransferase [Deltaproteobacteria bacterium]